MSEGNAQTNLVAFGANCAAGVASCQLQMFQDETTQPDGWWWHSCLPFLRWAWRHRATQVPRSHLLGLPGRPAHQRTHPAPASSTGSVESCTCPTKEPPSSRREGGSGSLRGHPSASHLWALVCVSFQTRTAQASQAKHLASTCAASDPSHLVSSGPWVFLTLAATLPHLQSDSPVFASTGPATQLT